MNKTATMLALTSIAGITLVSNAGAAPMPPASQPASPAMVALGQLLFNDTALSASGRQSCATCHAPSNAFTANNYEPVPRGGAGLSFQGMRNSPTILYASLIPAFSLHAPTPNPTAKLLNPAGGFQRDGREASLASQAQQPFITIFEMGNLGSSQVAARLKSRPYLAQFSAVFGAAVLKDADATLAAMGTAIAAFERSPAFQPFNSKYDAYIKGQTKLSAQESAGLQVFTDPNKGHCAACHATVSPSGTPAPFTDFTYHVLGVPRNWKIAYNLDSTPLPSFLPANGLGLGAPNHNYYDMGLCGPLRSDLSNETSLCGSFKVPTLRNVGVKQAYFHNGVFSSLQEVVSWYATRNSNPARWYRKPDGTPDILYNDLPVAYAGNVEPTNLPGRPLAPNLNGADILNLVSFLCTLNDGFDPRNPSAYNTTGQCSGK